jgi:hypothetical protein
MQAGQLASQSEESFRYFPIDLILGQGALG